MKYKFPRKITIGDTDFDVIYDKKEGGGEFSFAFKNERAFLKIGTRELKTNPHRFLAIVIHELKEMIQVEQGVRFNRNDEHSANSLEFHYTHKEHTDLCSRLAGLLTQFIK